MEVMMNMMMKVMKKVIMKVMTKVNAIYEKLGNRTNQKSDSKIEYEDESEEQEDEVSTQFLRMQKNQLIELQQQYERYVNTLPVFGFNSGKYDLNLIKSYLIPYLVNVRDIQPTVIKKSNHFV